MLRCCWMVLALLLGACQSTPPASVPAPVPAVPPKIGYALGGGGARGFAHVGVIKMLESQGITPDYIVGTSAGSIAGALYAAGYSGFDLQEIVFQLDEATVTDWQWFGRGLIKGQALQDFIDKAVGNRSIEKLKRPFACVAAKLHSGEPVLFQRGPVGLAVRASAAVPGIFEPVRIDGEDYVDGGTVSPLPIHYARTLGADVVIAVDVSSPPEAAGEDGKFDVLLKSFDIMGRALRDAEAPAADVVIRPDLHAVASTDFEGKHRAILAGEKAALEAMPAIRAAIAAKTRSP